MIDSYAALAAAIESKGFVDYPVRFSSVHEMCSPNPVVSQIRSNDVTRTTRCHNK